MPTQVGRLQSTMTTEPRLLHNSLFTFEDAAGAEMSCHLQLWHRGPHQALIIASRLPNAADSAVLAQLVLAAVTQRWAWTEDAVFIEHIPASPQSQSAQWLHVEWERNEIKAVPSYTPVSQYMLTTMLDRPLAPFVFGQSTATLRHNDLFMLRGTNTLPMCCHLQVWQITAHSFLAVATDLPRGNPGQSVTNAVVAIGNTIRHTFKLHAFAHLELIEHYTAGRYGGDNDPETWDRVVLIYGMGTKVINTDWQPSSLAEVEALLGRSLEPIELPVEKQYQP